MKYKKHNAAFDKVLTALQVLSRVDCCPPDTLPPRDKWPKARDIADYCDTNIYVSRYYLMKLVNRLLLIWMKYFLYWTVKVEKVLIWKYLKKKYLN